MDLSQLYWTRAPVVYNWMSIIEGRLWHPMQPQCGERAIYHKFTNSGIFHFNYLYILTHTRANWNFQQFLFTANSFFIQTNYFWRIFKVRFHLFIRLCSYKNVRSLCTLSGNYCIAASFVGKDSVMCPTALILLTKMNEKL